MTLDASASTDPGGGPLVSYRWDVDGSGGADLVSTEPVVSYTFLTAGSHPVTLAVRDADGVTARVTQTVAVGGAASAFGVTSLGLAAAETPRVQAPDVVRAAALRRGLPVRLRFAHRVRLALYDGARRIGGRVATGRTVVRIRVGRAARARLGRRGHRVLTLRVRSSDAVTATSIRVTRG